MNILPMRDNGLNGHYSKTSSTYQQESDSPILSESSTIHKRKLRAAVFYVLASMAHELLVYKIANKTIWANAVILIPLEAMLLTLASGAFTFLANKKSDTASQRSLSQHEPLISFKLWRESLPLVALLVSSSAVFSLQAGFLEMAVSTSVTVGALLPTKECSLLTSINNMFIDVHDTSHVSTPSRISALSSFAT